MGGLGKTQNPLQSLIQNFVKKQEKIIQNENKTTTTACSIMAKRQLFNIVFFFFFFFFQWSRYINKIFQSVLVIVANACQFVECTHLKNDFGKRL